MGDSDNHRCEGQHKSCPGYWSMFERVQTVNLFVSQRMCVWYWMGGCNCPENIRYGKKSKVRNRDGDVE
jgi:hypothetical protein